MTNTNCLEGVKCPACGNEDRLLIAAHVIAEVTDDGADIASPKYGGGFEWDDDSYARCPECDREGALRDFRGIPPAPTENRPYSVLLLYPDYANDGGDETYYAWVEAPDPVEAVTVARRQALAAQEGLIFPPDDFTPLLVTEGHHRGEPLSIK
jgi:hypothetical protein